MNLTVDLKKGMFYQIDGKKPKIYLIGDKIPAIPNVCACIISTDGTMSDDIEALYHRQASNFRLLTKNIPKIKSSYRRHLQHLMFNRYLYTTDENELPNVDKFLDKPNEYVKEQPTDMIDINEKLRTGEY